MTLTEFLLARIHEDVAVAGFAAHAASSREETAAMSSELGGSSGLSKSEARHAARHDPVRVLTDCEAKKRIVQASDDDALYRYAFDVIRPRLTDPDDWTGGAMWALDFAMRCLAAVYSDHPDYNASWKP